MNVIRKISLYILIVAFLISLSSESISVGAIIGKVTSIEGQYMKLDIGANKGITVGDMGRVYYTVKIEGKERTIYIAKFEVTHISQGSCMAQIQVKTGDVKVGLFAEILRAGDLEVTSAPSGASVHINGKLMGVTPYEGKNFSPGPYKIRAEKEGYETWEKQITVENGRTKQVLAELVVLKIGELEVNSEPAGAKIYLDGRGAGETPSVLSKINPGRHRVQVKKDGYVPYEETVEIRARERTKFEASLKRVTGGIIVVAEPPDANISIDGNRVGGSPYEGKGVPPGKHKVRIEKEGYASWEKEVVVKANEQAQVTAKLKRMSGGIVIRTEPSVANIYIDGNRSGVSPYEGKDMTPGKHRVRVEKEGYETWEGEVTVVAERNVEVPVALKSKTGELAIQSEPTGAKAYFNGKEIGDTPIKVSGIPPGRYDLRVIKEGYTPHEEQVRIAGGKSETVQVSLKKSVGNLLIRSEPGGADISIGGKSVGVSPYEGKNLSPGIYKVRIEKEGYDVWEGQVVIEAGKIKEASAKLELKVGELEVRSEPTGVQVSLDGKEIGETPLVLKGMSPGRHRIKITKEGYAAHEENVEVSVKERVKVDVSLKRLVGGLLIQTEPPGANVYVDGKSLGVSPHEAKELLPGTHRVRIVKEGYEAWEKEVMVEGGKKAEIRPQLVKVEVVKAREPPSDSQAKVIPEKTEKLPALKQGAPIWNINDSWGFRNEEGKTWEIKVVKIEGNLYIVKNTADNNLLGIDKRTLEAKLYITTTGKRSRDTEMGDFQFKFPLELNKKWNHMITAVPTSTHVPGNFSNEYRVIANEDITVRAGTFRAFRLELKQIFVSGITANMSSKKAYIWYSPEIKKEVKVLYEGSYWGNKANSFELTSYKLSQD